MSPDEDTCPQCGAVVRPDAPWCTLCLASLRADAPAEPAAQPVPATVPATASIGSSLLPASGSAADPLTAPLPDLVGPAPAALTAPRPTTSVEPAVAPVRRGRHAADPVTDAPAAAGEPADESVDVMLSLLKAEHAQDPALPLASVMDRPGARVAVIVGGMALLTLAGVLGLFVLGLFT